METNSKLTTFTFNGELYIRVIPSKNLFRSTLIHEVVNRGDVFAVRVSDSTLTIVPGTADVEHSAHTLIKVERNVRSTATTTFNKIATTRTPSEAETVARKRLRELAEDLRQQRINRAFTEAYERQLRVSDFW